MNIQNRYTAHVKLSCSYPSIANKNYKTSFHNYLTSALGERVFEQEAGRSDRPSVAGWVDSALVGFIGLDLKQNTHYPG